MKNTKLLSCTKKTIIISVLTIAAVQTLAIMLVFIFMKKGYAGDEVYSYGTSNSSEAMSPLVDMDGTLHINEWLTPDQLLQSVVVSKDEIFDYGHINEILKYDAHPPLYFYILHFFSTIFIGKFSWIPSIIINSFSIFACLIYFYRLFLLISNNRTHSILAMVFFGCTSATINMMTFSRNYTLLTALTVVFSFYIFRSMSQHNQNKKTTTSIILAAVFLYLASLTQYLSVAFGFFITLFICIYYLVKKDIRFVLKISLSMSASIGLLILTFPYIFNQLSSDQTAMENSTAFPFLMEIRVAIHILFNELFGLNTSIYPSMVPFWLFWGTIAIVVLYMIVRFLFRSDAWFVSFEKRILEFSKTMLNKIRLLPVVQYFIILLTIAALVPLISYFFKMYFYYPISDRYLFILYPYVIILILLPLIQNIKSNLIKILLVIFFVILSLCSGKKPYIGNSDSSFDTTKALLNDSDVVIFVPDHYSANCSVLYLEDCRQLFYTTKSTFYENKDLFIHKLSNDNSLYMLYYWPTYSISNTNNELMDLLKDLRDFNIITLDDNTKYHGASLIKGVNGHLLLRLR